MVQYSGTPASTDAVFPSRRASGYARSRSPLQTRIQGLADPCTLGRSRPYHHLVLLPPGNALVRREQQVLHPARSPPPGRRADRVLAGRPPMPTPSPKPPPTPSTMSRAPRRGVLMRAEPAERGCPGGMRRSEHTGHHKIISLLNSSPAVAGQSWRRQGWSPLLHMAGGGPNAETIGSATGARRNGWLRESRRRRGR